MSDVLIITEKPSVARDIARVVGASQSGEGVLSGNGYQITWAFGHLVTLPEPHEIQSDWKMWKKSSLPMLPRSWPLKIIEGTRVQFQIIQSLIQSCDRMICATDAGREGELIFRYILEAATQGSRLHKVQIQRLWVSSLTPDAIRAGLNSLKDASSYQGLADAARARSQADWLVGMNYSRAYALTTNQPLFVGRVQTPTLGLVVQRDLEIRNFKPETYFDLTADFHTSSGDYIGNYLGEESELRANHEIPKPKRLPIEGDLAHLIEARVKNGKACVASLENKTLKQQPPLLYDLTELQRHANRLFGFSAAQTLDLAQALYEKHKLISYPRTDSRHLSHSVAETLPGIVAAIRGPYEELLDPETGERALSSRFVDDAEVSDHHAIIPTGILIASRSVNAEERKIYDLICRRLLSAWQGDYVTALTICLTYVESSTPRVTDVFRTQGTLVQEMGWKRLEWTSVKERSSLGEVLLPEGLKKGLLVEVLKTVLKKKTTEPPPHLTEAALLSAMETAGRKLEDQELAKAMRETGLGTPATRASIIETLLSRNYVERQGKSLISTSLGEQLIETVHDAVKSPELTGRWERDLARIQSGQKSLGKFISELEQEIQQTVGEILKAESVRSPVAAAMAPSVSLDLSDLGAILKSRFGFEKFRPHQEEICRAVATGNDVLVVMPTGAGKSLCYQLPGIARGGTTLVISPLVALIDDQTAKLRSMGLRADRIHSGRSREDSRTCCIQYLSGQLDFLFVAPERLALSGFIDMLKKRRPSLIAIDEAHCISQWGHDFRPNYRLLGERLEEFRPVPVVALTATATPLVQDDIVAQLGFKNEKRFIQGFRRSNIAIQVLNVPTNQRLSASLTLLKKPGRCPAIIYAPTRKAAEALSNELKAHFKVEVYHAGMTSSARDRTQELYLGGKLDVIVATIAFGMGIDKADVRTVIHAGLPGSVEGYYQEIGRAGRDGLPSQAFLLHSYSDQKTHEFFFERDYPDSRVLKQIYDELEEGPIARSIAKNELKERLRFIDRDTFDKALEKLWIHQGARIDADENITRGGSGWERTYHHQSDHKRKQLREIVAFSESTGCRMSYLIRHFGDQTDSGVECGICDSCVPDAAPFQIQSRTFSENEQKIGAQIMAILAGQNGQAVGRIFEEIRPQVERRTFEGVLNALVRAKWITVDQASFERSGEIISYRKASLTEIGSDAGADDLAEIVAFGETEFSSATKSRKRSRSKAAEKKVEKRLELDAASNTLFETLRAWRLALARKKGVPAFRILSDRVLESLCEDLPANENDLLDVPGIGPKLAAQYGSDLLKMIQERN